MKEPRILLYDIETTHNIVALFQLFHNDYVSHQNVLNERYIVCAAWKVLGEKQVHAVSTLDDAKLYAKDPHSDLHVCKRLHEELSKADVIVAHNGDQYDIKFSEARMIKHGLSPLPPITKIDTLKTAKDRFLFNSNKLDYLGQYLEVGKKIPTEPGLWLGVLKGDKSAIRKMVEYNKGDVELLERVFNKLRPYMANFPNRELYGDKGCPRCGSLKIQRRGVHRAVTQTYQRYQCMSCEGWFRKRKADKNTSTESRVL